MQQFYNIGPRILQYFSLEFLGPLVVKDPANNQKKLTNRIRNDQRT